MNGGADGGDDPDAITANRVAHPDNHLGQGGEGGIESFEEGLETGDEKDEQKNEDGNRQKKQDRRIQQRGNDLGAQLFFARLKVGDLTKDDIEKAASFPRLDHGDI